MTTDNGDDLVRIDQRANITPGGLAAIKRSLRMVEQERDALKAYADELAAGLPEGMLPADVANVRRANEVFAAENEKLREDMGVIGDQLTAAEHEMGALRADLAMLQAQLRWVPVGERLPDDEIDVLAVSEGSDPFVAFMRKGKWYLDGRKVRVTAWMDLPAGPVEVGE